MVQNSNPSGWIEVVEEVVCVDEREVRAVYDDEREVRAVYDDEREVRVVCDDGSYFLPL